MIVCRFSERSGVAASRSAASGDTRLARRAGMTAATAVTSVPTANDAITVRRCHDRRGVRQLRAEDAEQCLETDGHSDPGRQAR